jgi:hypothetical protein
MIYTECVPLCDSFPHYSFTCWFSPLQIKLAGLPYSAALDALDNAPFPCTLVLKRLPALAASIAANQRLALPKPLYRGLRVRVGCFTGAPEAERDPVGGYMYKLRGRRCAQNATVGDMVML